MTLPRFTVIRIISRAIALLLAGCALGGCANPGPGGQAEREWQLAYAAQHQSQARHPPGFKAGLTSAASRQQFASDRSVAGVLPRQLAVGVPVALDDFDKPMLEVELAFRLGESVSEPLTSVAELKQRVAVIAPAFELPDLGGLAGGPPTPLEIVRANVAAHSFVVGEPIELPLDLVDHLTVRVWHNGAPSLESSSGALLGGVWQALLELVNNRVRYGWVIEPDQWLLTGAIGGMRPLAPQEYVAEFLAGAHRVGRLQLLVEPVSPAPAKGSGH